MSTTRDQLIAQAINRDQLIGQAIKMAGHLDRRLARLGLYLAGSPAEIQVQLQKLQSEPPARTPGQP